MAQDTDQPAAAAVGEHPADDDDAPKRRPCRSTRTKRTMMGPISG